MLKNVFAAVRRAQQIVMLFDDVRGVRKCWIEGSYKGYMFRFVDVFGLSNFVTKQIRRAADIPRNLTLQTKDVFNPKFSFNRASSSMAGFRAVLSLARAQGIMVSWVFCDRDVWLGYWCTV